jgi:hypothetical protein
MARIYSCLPQLLSIPDDNSFDIFFSRKNGEASQQKDSPPLSVCLYWLKHRQ